LELADIEEKEKDQSKKFKTLSALRMFPTKRMSDKLQLVVCQSNPAALAISDKLKEPLNKYSWLLKNNGAGPKGRHSIATPVRAWLRQP
jgi:hypothetical protein